MTLSKPINVAQVPKRSLFRYPGGKTWLIPWVRLWLAHSRCRIIVEPFAGSGIVSLTAVAERYCDQAVMAEIDPDVASVWLTVLNGDATWLIDRISNFQFTAENASRVIRSEAESLREKAFRTIVHNRASRGGIMAEGAGLVKNGENGKGISSRWYPSTLVSRINEILSLKERITFIEGDAFSIIQNYIKNPHVALFLDPPYTIAGRRLYHFNEIDHERLFFLAAKHTGPCLLTYDDAADIRKLAHKNGFRFRRIIMQNTHLAKKKELIIEKEFSWLPKK